MSIRSMTWVFRQALPPREKVAALAIADEADDSGLCFTRNSKLAAKASLSLGTFKRAKKQLIEWGLLEQTAQIMASGRQTTNLLQLRIDRDVPFEVAEATMQEGSNSDPIPEDDSEKAAETGDSALAGAGGVQSEPLEIVEEISGDGVKLTPTGDSTVTPSGESSGDSPITRFTSPSLSSAEVVPNFGSIKPPPLPSRKAAGSAGEDETVDRDSSHFIAAQFEQMKTTYQQFNKAGFIGSEPLPWAKFRKWPFEKRHEAVMKLPLYFKGFNASFARWTASPSSERGPKPKCASLREYVCGEMFEKLGWPQAPITPPRPPSAAWCDFIRNARRGQFDADAFFIAAESQAFRDWKAAERKAGTACNGARRYTRRSPDGEKPEWSGYGLFYAREYPPGEDEFEIEEAQAGKDAAAQRETAKDTA